MTATNFKSENNNKNNMDDSQKTDGPSKFGMVHGPAGLVVRLRAMADDDKYAIDEWSEDILREAAAEIEKAEAPDKGVGTGDLFCAALEWHKGPAEDGEGTAGKDENGAPLFYNGDHLLLIIETNKGREIAVVDIDCDEDYFRVTDASSGDDYDAWGPESWSWWAKLDKRNTPPTSSQNSGDELRPQRK